MIWHVSSMSGGKDSVPTTLIAREEVQGENLVMCFADTGNEEDVTYEYVYDYLPGKLELPLVVVRADFSEEFARKRLNLARIAAGEPESDVYGKREFDYPWTPEAAAKALELLHPTGNPYLDLCMVRGGFPSRKRQFCTEYLKRNPIIEYQEKQIAEHGAVWSWQGVRADESASRKPLRCTAGGPACDKGFEVVGGGLFIRRPIIRWKAADCFETMKYFGVKPNPLYSQGFSRVGCFPCINASKAEISQIARRYPEHVDRIAKWEELVSSVTRPGSKATFFHVRTISGDIAPALEHDISRVVQWAKTTRGGKQYDLLGASADSSACASSYGLCDSVDEVAA